MYKSGDIGTKINKEIKIIYSLTKIISMTLGHERQTLLCFFQLLTFLASGNKTRQHTSSSVLSWIKPSTALKHEQISCQKEDSSYYS